MLRKLLLSICVISALFQSCVPTRIGQVVSRCQSTDCLRRNLGPPKYIIDNGDQGVIWLYTERWVRSSPGIITGNESTILYTMPSTIEYDKYVKFWVKGKYVFNWESSGHELQKLSTGGWIGVGAGAIIFAALMTSGY